MALQPSLRPQVIIGQYEAIHTLDIFCTCMNFYLFIRLQVITASTLTTSIKQWIMSAHSGLIYFPLLNTS